MENITLYNEVELPAIGLGTHKIPNDQMQRVIADAYEVGYRKFDTAWLYGNETYIGEAIQNLGLHREGLFLTSKLHIDNLYLKGYHRRYPNIKVRSVRKAFEQSCKRLHTDYLDLYLLHWPFPRYEKMWEEMVKLYEEGRIRAIGVSSFLPTHLDELISKTGFKPMVNQFEISPLNNQKEAIAYNQKLGVHAEAYSLFGTTNRVSSLSY